jgi:ATP-binding cassette ChvD family protein
MSTEIVYSLVRVNKSYSSRKVLEDITLGFYKGAKIGVIGGNGSGKSTLLRILALKEEASSGQVLPQKGLRIGYLSQEPVLDAGATVRENVEPALQHVRDLLREHEELGIKLGEPLSDAAMQKVMDRMSDVGDEIERIDGWTLDSQVEQAMHALRCPPPDALVANLSGGEKRRVALTRLLLEKPDFLLLDEPTNHLDADTVAWLEKHLQDYAGTIVLVTHDRYFLDNVVKWMLELERGVGTPYEGNYSLYLEQKSARLAAEEKERKDRSKILDREIEWVRQGRKGRSLANKARIRQFAELQAKDETLQDGTVDLVIPSGKRLGDKVIELLGVKKGYGDRILIDDLSFTLPPGAILGIIGPNGTGKTTLLKLISSQEKVDGGKIAIGETVEVCHIDQGREDLDPSKTVFQEITGGTDEMMLGKVRVKSRAYVGKFNFKGQDQEQLVGSLSGGQRNRVQLAKKIREGGNLLLLDEPTNDLDLMTLRVLEEAIQRFAGSAIVVSHDRWFLDRICTHMLVFEDEGKTDFLEGNYADYEAWKEARGEKATAAAARGGAHRRFTRE